MTADPLERAVAILRGGGLVAFPTETVYGLGADARNPDAVRRIFAAKGRPAGHPLIVHLASAEALPAWVADVPDDARRLAEAFWPGPLTVILGRHPSVPTEVTGGQDTIGIRVPDHELARALLTAFGGGLAAPSANRFGGVSPTTAAHVLLDLGAAVDLILDGGACRVGVESTIVDLSGAEPRALRPGGVPWAAVERVLGRPLAHGPGGTRTPGSLASHYAPNAVVRVVGADAVGEEAARSAADGHRVVVLGASPPGVASLPFSADPADAARELYARLHEVDEGGFDLALVVPPGPGDLAEAVGDRLLRAGASRPSSSRRGR